jgi:CRISPR system Cascade subunit CasC
LDADADKLDEDSGAAAAYLGNTELTSGLFYGYTVLDIATLVANTTGCSPKDWLNADRSIAAKVVEHLLMLISTVSPAAKKGSTAPFSYSELTLVEAGSRQPRSLARAFRKPLHPTQTDQAGNVMADFLAVVDENYGRREARRMMAFYQQEMPGAEKVTMLELAEWAGAAVRNGRAE